MIDYDKSITLFRSCEDIVDFKDVAKIVRHRWVSIVVIVAAALVTAGAVSFLVTPQYASTARVFVSSETRSTQDAYTGSLFSAQRVQSYADLADSREVMRQVGEELGLEASPKALANQVDASVVQDTVIVLIQATDADPAAAKELAQATAERLAAYIVELETTSARSRSPVKATVVDPAELERSPVSPNLELNFAVALALGLLLGVSFAIGREALDTTVKSVEDVESVLEAPVLATVTYDAALEKSGASATGVHSLISENFRMLRTTLQYVDLDGDPRSFVITSALPQEGKSSTALGLASAVAQTGKRVLLVDGDLRQPSLAERLRLVDNVGLTSVLVGQVSLEQGIQLHKASGVHVLTSGALPPNPTEILQSQAARTLFTQASELFDIVIIDSPPLLPVADAAILAADADGALLVTRYGKTHKHDLELAKARLEAVGARLFGGVVNMTPAGGSRGYGYGTRYGYLPGKEDKRKSAREAGQETRQKTSL